MVVTRVLCVCKTLMRSFWGECGKLVWVIDDKFTIAFTNKHMYGVD